ncbi:MAG: LacI family DNA-binding transcriptional regulator, partial [Pseudobutyrivibrio sp.]|nr:LacI family DNA-binding transcriptional regulator [Pseudobutyrivibrio sp.]
MVSLKDIASRCGVSVATVSKSLNDHSDIGQETKQRVRQVAKELGYVPNAAAKSMKTNRTHNLGVLFMDDANSGLTHDFFA